MKVIEIFGLARSGHHAMTNWVIKNFCGEECPMEWKLSILKDGLVYINEGNLDKDVTLKYIKDQKDILRTLILSYENCSTNFTVLNSDETYYGPLSINNKNLKTPNENYRIVFIRNFYDNLASRIKSNEHNLSKDRDGNFIPWDIGEKFIEDWKNHAKEIVNKKCLYLKFEDWLSSVDVRNDFMIKIINHGEYYDNKVKGTQSSFYNDDVYDRISKVNVPEKTKYLISKDSELHYLIGRLGYDYRIIDI
jgi:hypothetical protein